MRGIAARITVSTTVILDSSAMAMLQMMMTGKQTISWTRSLQERSVRAETGRLLRSPMVLPSNEIDALVSDDIETHKANRYGYMATKKFGIASSPSTETGFPFAEKMTVKSTSIISPRFG